MAECRGLDIELVQICEFLKCLKSHKVGESWFILGSSWNREGQLTYQSERECNGLDIELVEIHEFLKCLKFY